jgi:hypothetical protein
MMKMAIKTTHQSLWRSCKAAQIVRLKKTELMIEIVTRMIVDHIMVVIWSWLGDSCDY